MCGLAVAFEEQFVQPVRHEANSPSRKGPGARQHLIRRLCSQGEANLRTSPIGCERFAMNQHFPKEYYQALLILSGLCGLEKTVQQEARTVLTIDLSENEVLGPAYAARPRGRSVGVTAAPNRAAFWRAARMGCAETLPVHRRGSGGGCASSARCKSA